MCAQQRGASGCCVHGCAARKAECAVRNLAELKVKLREAGGPEVRLGLLTCRAYRIQRQVTELLPNNTRRPRHNFISMGSASSALVVALIGLGFDESAR
jgi:hypothetical protein